jgi:predicted nucleotidyltransferase component of viral defense system
MTPQNIAASVRARLLNHARDSKQTFDKVLLQYAIERLIYRLSISKYANQFFLKGAQLFKVWFDIPQRPTRDIDLLGTGSAELSHIQVIFKEICSINETDGIEFDINSVTAIEIRNEANYPGVRVTLISLIDSARSSIQIDIGFGDAITPNPDSIDYPVLLPEQSKPRLKAYPRYTVVAEKFEAMVSLGLTNSRMKDYFDLWVLAQHTEFDGNILQQAIQATFSRRSTPMTAHPIGLSTDFALNPDKQKQWHAFLQKNALDGKPLEDVMAILIKFLQPVVVAITTNQPLILRWQNTSWVD